MRTTSFSSKILPRLAWGICIGLGLALSFKAVREPDLWWMYRTGEWMLEQGQVTYNDPFSYTFAGAEWINVKWLFEVFIAWGKSWFGPSFALFWQGMVTVLLLVLMGRSAQWIRQATTGTETRSLPFGGLILVALLVLVTVDFRLIGRPEMHSHLFTMAYLYLFWRYYYAPSKAILWLIPLQLLWTNVHEAFGIGLALIVGYTVANWVQYALSERFKWPAPELKWLHMGALGAFMAVGINPRGASMWLHPFNIFGQLSDNQFTTELASIGHSDYWEWQAYANLFFFVGTLLFVVLLPYVLRRQQGHSEADASAFSWWRSALTRFGMGNGAVTLMLLYLSTTAYRNIPFFVLAAAPLVAVGLQQVFERYRLQRLGLGLGLLLGLGLYGSLISGHYHKNINTLDKYGLQVLSSHNPIGAATFIEEQGIEGKCFAGYLTSAYLLWHLQPDFKTYIDLRDLDIFPKEFFLDFARLTAVPSAFQEQADSMDLDYVVLFRPQYASLHQYLTQSPDYDLVFVDPVACVYLRRKPKFQAIIDQYGYTQRGYADVFSDLPVVPSTSLAYAFSKLLNPFYQPTDYSEVDQNAIAGSFFLTLQNTERAFERANASIQAGVEPWKGYELLGNMYNNAAFNASTPDSMRAQYIQLALTQYNNAIEANPDYVQAYVNKSVVYLQQEDFLPATLLLQQALDLDPNHPSALQYMMMVYKIRATQSQDYNAAQQWLDFALRIDRLNPNNPFIRLDIGLAYCTLKDCSKAMEYLDGLLETPGLPEEELKTARRCVANCGQ